MLSATPCWGCRGSELRADTANGASPPHAPHFTVHRKGASTEDAAGVLRHVLVLPPVGGMDGAGGAAQPLTTLELPFVLLLERPPEFRRLKPQASVNKSCCCFTRS